MQKNPCLTSKSAFGAERRVLRVEERYDERVAGSGQDLRIQLEPEKIGDQEKRLSAFTSCCCIEISDEEDEHTTSAHVERFTSLPRRNDAFANGQSE